MTRNLKNVRPPRQECRLGLSVSMASLASPPPMLPAIPFLLGKVTFPVHSLIVWSTLFLTQNAALPQQSCFSLTPAAPIGLHTSEQCGGHQVKERILSSFIWDSVWSWDLAEASQSAQDRSKFQRHIFLFLTHMLCIHHAPDKWRAYHAVSTGLRFFVSCLVGFKKPSHMILKPRMKEADTGDFHWGFPE